MDDDETKQNLETNIFRKLISKVSYAGDVLQPLWVRRGSILSLFSNRKFILRQFNLVLYIGVIFWSLLLISKIF